jgi:hypothetical protein
MAASGSAHMAYQGSSQAVDSNSASVAQPAIVRQSAPRAVRHRLTPSTTTNPTTHRSRHQLGSPLSSSQRAVSAGMLWVAISCCCSPIESKKPNACVPKPTTATIASSMSAAAALIATRARSLIRRGASTMNGSTSPTDAFTPTPTTSSAAAARKLGVLSAFDAPATDASTVAVPTVSSRAPASTNSTSASLCAPPTASSSVTGFKPTNAAAHFAERPILCAARAINATAPKLQTTATAFSAHRPLARPSGASG